jgi:septum formation protein
LPLIPPADKSQAVILAADTAVVLKKDILGKPTGAGEAGVMLRRLRDRSHQVYLLLCWGLGWRVLSEIVATEVRMRAIRTVKFKPICHR